MIDNDVETILGMREGLCAHCQRELETGTALYMAYIHEPPLSSNLPAIIQAMDEQTVVIETLHGRCCRGGN